MHALAVSFTATFPFRAGESVALSLPGFSGLRPRFAAYWFAIPVSIQSESPNPKTNPLPPTQNKFETPNPKL